MGIAALLDTHAFIWSLNEPERLSNAAREVIINPDNALYVSSATAWELATKYRLGRLPNAKALIEDFAAHVSDLSAKRLDITYTHALQAGLLDGAHKDPFDRILIAQAQLENLQVITKDPAFKAFDAQVLW